MTRTTKLVLSGVAVAVAVVAALAAALLARYVGGDDAFVIDRFHRHVVVEPSGALEVTETIAVTFREPRRGIFRDLESQSPAGGSVSYVVHGVDRGEDDRPWTYAEQRTDDGEPRIRIGDPDVVLDPGPQTYRLRYRVDGMLLRPAARPDQVHLRLDVPGDRWPTQVAATELTVELPAPPTLVRCVVGTAGTTGGCGQAARSGTTVTQTVGELRRRETATIAVEVPAVAFPDEARWVPQVAVGELDQREPFAPLGVPLVPATVLLLALLVAPAAALEAARARRVYRDAVTDPHLHDRVTPTAELAPPDGLAPAELAALAQRSIGDQTLLATLVDLELRGVVRSTTSADGGTITIGPGPDPARARPWEAEVLAALCPGGATITFDGEYDPTTTKRSTLAEHALRTHVGRVLGRGSRYVHGGGGALRGGGYVLGIGLVLLCWAAVGLLGGQLLDVPRPAVVVAWVGLAAAWLVLAWLWRAERLPLTSEGRDAVARVRAFRTFLAAVHADRLAFAASRADVGTTHPAVAMLPYAVALGLAASWLERFEPLLVEAARQGRAGAAGDPSAWYLHRGGFAAATTAHSSSTTAPSSSGGGAGGGAGSGGGGGGGGSW